MKALIDVTDVDPDGCSPLIYAENLLERESNPAEDVIVLAHGKGVKFLTEPSEKVDEIRSLMERGVTFKASRPCVNAQGENVEDIIEGVELIPHGSNEVFDLQADGYNVAKIP